MKQAEKIRALLAKAARTDNEHEAQACQTLAEELMVKWGIDDAMVAAAGLGPADKVIQLRFDLFAEDEAVGYMAMFNAICSGLGGLKCIFVEMPPGSAVVPLYAIGFPSDVERFRMLWEFVYPQAEAALEAWWQRFLAGLMPMQYIDDYTRGHRRSQFLMSYGNAIGDRLRKEREMATEQTTGADLAVISRDEKVDEHMAEAYPDMHTKHVSIEHNYSAELAGFSGGNSANLRVKSQLGGT